MEDKEAIERLADDLEQLEGWSLRSEAGRYYIANRLYHAGYRKVPSGEPSIISNDEIGLTISEIRLEAGESVAQWNWSCFRAVAKAQRNADARFYKGNQDEKDTAQEK